MPDTAADTAPDITAEIAAEIARLKARFGSGATRPLAWRRAQLAGIEAMCREREEEIFAALHADLGKPPVEAFTHETGLVALHARQARRNLGRWARPRRQRVDLFNLPARAWLTPEPRGAVLILAPWNYPFHLSLIPLVPALAAGNVAVLKPSELAPATSALLARLVPAYLDPDAVRVVEGGVATAEALLAEPWGLVFFTGSAAVGRRVMQAAGRTLSPVVLELGGKSPAIIARDADLDLAARRIAWGKLLNAGQTCVAPDHVLVERGMQAATVDALAGHFRRFLRDRPKASRDYARIVNRRHFDRLMAMRAEGVVAAGGRADAAQRFIEPTVLTDLPEGAAALEEEIFGPLLPVIEVDDIDAAIARVNAGPKPLALYLFSRDRAIQRAVVARTSSGAVVFNDVVMQFSLPDAPFGGVGESGMGSYHGRPGFDSFSHLKPVLRRPTWFDPALRYPPYSKRRLRWLRKIF